MNPLALKWFLTRYSAGERIDHPHPAIRYQDKTYVLGSMMRINRLREDIKSNPLPAPIVPVIVMDMRTHEDLPRGRWLRVCRSGLWYCDGDKREPVPMLNVEEWNLINSLCPTLCHVI